MLHFSSQDSSGGPASVLHANLSKSSSSADGDKVENDETISDTDLDYIVGSADNSEIQVWPAQNCLFCLWSSLCVPNTFTFTF